MDQQHFFRKESLDHISSPEELHSYLRVTSPRLWMLLSAILVILIGFVIYASTTVMESAMKVKFDVETITYENNSVTTVLATLPLSQKDAVETGMAVRLAGHTGKVSMVFHDAESTSVIVDMGVICLPLPDGEYEGEIVTESTTPLSFLLN